MPSQININRRDFLKVGLGTSTGLMIGFNLFSCGDSKSDVGNGKNSFAPNIWIRIDPEDLITIIVSESEMGQGVTTSMPMLVAEELEVDWNTIRFEQAPTNPIYGHQYTGGSSSVRDGWFKLRQAGAIAKSMLIRAAAQLWKIPEAQCKAQSGKIVNKITNQKVSYGDLIEIASKLPMPETVQLKDPEDFKIIGKSMPLLDAQSKVEGKTVYGCDVILPGMLIATIVHCPVFGGKVMNIEENDALNINGVKYILKLGNSVAIVATTYWAASKGKKALRIQWDYDKNDSVNSVSITQKYKNAASRLGEIISSKGNIEDAFHNAENKLDVVYETPFVAHATMEPMNCTAHAHDGECDIWAPTQAPSSARAVGAKYMLSKPALLIEKIKMKLTGHAFKNIRVHTTFLGGGFGRRLTQDYVAEAVQISKTIKKPVKLIWSREEDIQHDFYRPATYHKLTAGIDKNGNPVAWKHTGVGPSKGKTMGGTKNFPYSIPHRHVEFIQEKTSIPVGSWRSVGSSHNGFINESFIDELAASTKQDPFDFRMKLLKNSPRHKKVLELAAEKANWGKPLQKNRYRGIALHKSYGSYVAQVAEISVSTDKKIKVHRVVCAIDCGMVVNPNTVEAQIEGSIVFGLTACLKSAITIKDGRVEQSNFHDFTLLRMNEMPLIESYILPSTESPGGVGEPAVPPIAAAVANAVFAATGIRVRKLPIFSQDLIQA